MFKGNLIPSFLRSPLTQEKPLRFYVLRKSGLPRFKKILLTQEKPLLFYVFKCLVPTSMFQEILPLKEILKIVLSRQLPYFSVSRNPSTQGNPEEEKKRVFTLPNSPLWRKCP